MPTAVAPAPADVKQFAADVRTINVELASLFMERREIVEIIWIGILSKSHTFLLGPPGTAKSSLIKAICMRITGANFFRALMNKQLSEDAYFGRHDIEDMMAGKGWHRDVTNSLATAHVGFLDEGGKAGPAALNPLLTMLEEREYTPDDKVWLQANLISCISASNELLEEEGLAAIWDRFMLRYFLDYIKEPGNVARLLRSRVRSHTGTSTAVATFTTVDLADLQHIVDEVIPFIELPDSVVDAMVKLRADLAAAGIIASDRRWANSVPILQASAFYNGRDKVDDDDLLMLRHVLWDTPSQYEEVRRQVMALGSPVTRAAIELTELLDELEAEIGAQNGQSRGAKAAFGGPANHKASLVEEQLEAALAEAAHAKRSTTPLDTVSAQLKQVRFMILAELLNMAPDKARAAAGIS